MKLLSVDQHLAFRQSLAAPKLLDEIDDDDLHVDPYSGDPPSRRKDSELARVLSILDSLDGRGTH